MPEKREMLIYLYSGDGADEDCVNNTEEWIQNHIREVPKDSNISLRVKKVGPQDIANGDLGKEKPDVFFMPGGNASKYSKDLKGDSVQKIREFVKDGGLFQGICAGAYFASEVFYYENPKTGNKVDLKAEEDEILGVNHVKATSEPHEHLREEKIKNGCQVKVKYKDETGEDRFLQVYYNRGPYLKEIKDNVTPKGIYADIYEGEVAVAENDYGQGKVVVSGVHPEFSASRLQRDKVPFLSEKINDIIPEQQADLDHFSKTIVLKHVIDRYITLDKKLDIENKARTEEANEQLSKIEKSNPKEAVSSISPTQTKIHKQELTEKPKQQLSHQPKPPQT